MAEIDQGIKILVVGNGSREHTFLWKLCHSPSVSQAFITHGNAGTAKLATPIDVGSGDIEGILRNIKDKKIGFTFVGPENPLALGLVDVVQEELRGHEIFGPTRDGARIESSKIWAAQFNTRFGIPQPDYIEIYSPEETEVKIKQKGWSGMAVKADELDGGKGVVVCDSLNKALLTVDDFMVRRIHGALVGNRMLIQEKLEGQEVSVMAWVDGKNYTIMPPSVDYKAFKGKNTGGMGSFAPFKGIPIKYWDIIHRDILQRAVDGLREEESPFIGVLYAGLMITEDGPKVLEWNCRPGDPEAQSVLPLYSDKLDLLDVMRSCTRGQLTRKTIPWRSGISAVSIVLASSGYPDKPRTGEMIEGLDQELGEDFFIFHGGTKSEGNKVVTDGGRVLTVTARATLQEEARQKALSVIGKKGIHFKGMQYIEEVGQT